MAKAMNRKRVLSVGMALIMAMSTASLRAEPIQLAALSNIEGKVLVNKGKGFATAKPGTPLAEGDRVIALDGSRAAVVYKDGCVTQLKENSLLALDKAAGCGQEAVKTGGAKQPLRYAQAIGGTATDTGGSGGTTPGNDESDKECRDRKDSYPECGAIIPLFLASIVVGILSQISPD
jgi:hypothetical protein